MSYFSLPQSTNINRVIPKNAFDKYTNAKQKKLFVETVERIRWTNKIAIETVNLPVVAIKEIQVFQIELRIKNNIREILDVIDRSIPYHIVFVLQFKEKILFSTSKKHIHVTNEDLAVLDWNFSTQWLDPDSATIQFNLKENIDTVYADLCFQVSGNIDKKLTLDNLIERESVYKTLTHQIGKLESAIKNARQFNKKVELNIQLQEKIKQLESL